MKIENIDQLNVEIKRLEAKSIEQKAQLKQDFEEIKDDLTLKNFLIEVVSDLTGFRINRESVYQRGFFFALQLILGGALEKTGLKLGKEARILIQKATAGIGEFLKKIFKKKHKEAVPEDDGVFDGE